MSTKINWLEHLKILTDILDIFWDAKAKTIEKEKEKDTLRPSDVVAMANAKLMSPQEARDNLRKLGVHLEDDV